MSRERRWRLSRVDDISASEAVRQAIDARRADKDFQDRRRLIKKNQRSLELLAE
jgi:hypothetical protein